MRELRGWPRGRHQASLEAQVYSRAFSDCSCRTLLEPLSRKTRKHSGYSSPSIPPDRGTKAKFMPQFLRGCWKEMDILHIWLQEQLADPVSATYTRTYFIRDRCPQAPLIPQPAPGTGIYFGAGSSRSHLYSRLQKKGFCYSQKGTERLVSGHQPWGSRARHLLPPISVYGWGNPDF